MAFATSQRAGAPVVSVAAAQVGTTGSGGYAGATYGGVSAPLKKESMPFGSVNMASPLTQMAQPAARYAAPATILVSSVTQSPLTQMAKPAAQYVAPATILSPSVAHMAQPAVRSAAPTSANLLAMGAVVSSRVVTLDELASQGRFGVMSPGGVVEAPLVGEAFVAAFDGFAQDNPVLDEQFDGAVADDFDGAMADEFGGMLPPGTTPKDNFSTISIHAGQKPDPITGSRVTPIHQNTGFVFKNTDDAAAKFGLSAFGPIYTRIGNPTCDAAEGKIAAMEGGMAALSVSCGHAAQMVAFTSLMNRGDNFVASKQLYGGSITQFGRQFAQFGWEVRFVDVDDYRKMAAAVDEKTKAIYCESICNPGGVITDLEKVADIAKKNGIPLIVDNTTATPYLCRPFEFGADIVVHSATKYLSGHGNALCGFIVEKGDFDWGKSGKFPILSEPCASYHDMKFYDTFGKDGPVAEMFGTKGKTGLSFTVACRALGLRDVGACASPFNVFLTSMGMETLSLRMERHCSNAQKVAEFLEKHAQVASVSYAGLASNTYNALTKKYCPKGASGLFTFSCKGGFEAAKKVVNGVKMISLIANLGDTRTLIAHPASMMHSQLTPEQQKAAGAEPSVVRMSVGIEDVEDIINDLDQALKLTA